MIYLFYVNQSSNLEANLQAMIRSGLRTSRESYMYFDNTSTDCSVFQHMIQSLGFSQYKLLHFSINYLCFIKKTVINNHDLWFLLLNVDWRLKIQFVSKSV